MLKNVGSVDRKVRVVLGVLLAVVGVVGCAKALIPVPAVIVVAALSLIMFVTAAIQTCPLYLPCKINTNK